MIKYKLLNFWEKHNRDTYNYDPFALLSAVDPSCLCVDNCVIASCPCCLKKEFCSQLSAKIYETLDLLPSNLDTRISPVRLEEMSFLFEEPRIIVRDWVGSGKEKKNGLYTLTSDGEYIMTSVVSTSGVVSLGATGGSTSGEGNMNDNKYNKSTNNRNNKDKNIKISIISSNGVEEKKSLMSSSREDHTKSIEAISLPSISVNNKGSSTFEPMKVFTWNDNVKREGNDNNRNNLGVNNRSIITSQILNESVITSSLTDVKNEAINRVKE
jgi:hypothetical protein